MYKAFVRRVATLRIEPREPLAEDGDAGREPARRQTKARLDGATVGRHGRWQVDREALGRRLIDSHHGDGAARDRARQKPMKAASGERKTGSPLALHQERQSASSAYTS